LFQYLTATAACRLQISEKIFKELVYNTYDHGFFGQVTGTWKFFIKRVGIWDFEKVGTPGICLINIRKLFQNPILYIQANKKVPFLLKQLYYSPL
jgi:hypothetical protein